MEWSSRQPPAHSGSQLDSASPEGSAAIMPSSGEGSGSDSGFGINDAVFDTAAAAATLVLNRSPTATVTKQQRKNDNIVLPVLEVHPPATRAQRPKMGRDRSKSTGSRSGEPIERLLSVRRSNHRDYEQRRRNSIKEQFDGLRSCIPSLRGTSAHVSKQRILREAHDHIAVLLSQGSADCGAQGTLAMERKLSELQQTRLALSRDYDDRRSRVDAFKTAAGIKFEAIPKLVDEGGDLTGEIAYLGREKPALPTPARLGPVYVDAAAKAAGSYYVRNDQHQPASAKEERDAHASSRTPPLAPKIHSALTSIAAEAASP